MHIFDLRKFLENENRNLMCTKTLIKFIKPLNER